ncbi:hypothetical protein [Demequina soli]|uniref:hypothetical protein n=1 Tax=Demequina soli TaxID=1638987 RepID=UPI0007812535|nr:hypothetical protein [Demequina soli]
MDPSIWPVAALSDRPGTLNELKRLGNAIRDADAAAISSLHYDELWSWYNDLVAAVLEELELLDLSSVCGAPVLLTGRAKVRETVREKLTRRPSDKLPSIQDLAGIRIEGDMTLGAQDLLAAALVDHFGKSAAKVKDLRVEDHSGYRAVHVWVRLDRPKGAWFEIQIRTELQGEWANTYEALADLAGRSIRYGELPPDADQRQAVELLQDLSRNSIARAESIEDLLARCNAGTMPDTQLAPALAAMGITGAERAAQAILGDSDVAAVTLTLLRDTHAQVLDMLRSAQREIRSQSREGR